MATFLLVVFVSALAAIFAPRTYHSEGMLLVRLGKENATLDPTVTMGQDTVVSVPISRENELNSVVEILNSRAISEKVVDLLGPDFILGSPAASSTTDVPPGRFEQVLQQVQQTWGRAKELLHRLEGTSQLGTRDRAIAELTARYSASPTRKSDLVQVDCKGPSPAWSQKVVAALMEVYQSEHMRLNRPGRSVEFFAEQMERARNELEAKQASLRDLKTASGIFSPGDQRQSFAARLSRLEEEMLQNQAAATVSKTRVETLRKQLNSLPAEVVESVTSGFGNEATDQMRAQLYQLEVRKEEAAAKYTDAHPAKQALDEQLQASRAVVSNQTPTRTHIAKGQNRVHQDTEAALLQEQTLLAASQAKDEVLKSQLAAARGQLKGFNQNELLIAGLDRDVDVCQAIYRKYAAGLEQARIDQAKEIQRISNITVAQPATYEPLAVFPKKSMFLEIGLLCGLLSAVAVACWAEARDRSFREPEDVERHLGVVVLGSIPRFDVPHLPVAGKRRS